MSDPAVARMAVQPVVVVRQPRSVRVVTGGQGPAGPQGAQGPGGAMTGPGSAVDNQIAVFDGVTGGVLKAGGTSAKTTPVDADSVPLIDSAASNELKLLTIANLRKLFIIPIAIAASDEATALTTGTAKATFHFPRAFTAVAVMAEVSTAQTSGSILTIDVNEGGVSILSTEITIDNGEETSLSAATQPVLSDTSFAAGAKMTTDIVQVGDGTAKGLKVWLLGYWT